MFVTSYWTLIGAVLLVLPNGVIWYWGNLFTLVTSYILFHVGQPSDTETPWVISLYIIFRCLGVNAYDVINRKCGMLWTVVVGVVISDVAVALTFLGVQISLHLVNTLMGVMVGFGTGVLYGYCLQTVISLSTSNDGSLTSAVQGSFAGGAMVINQFVTLYANPDNISPNFEARISSQFTQKDILDRVPDLFLFVFGFSIIAHMIAFLCLYKHKSVAFGISKSDEERRIIPSSDITDSDRRITPPWLTEGIRRVIRTMKAGCLNKICKTPMTHTYDCHGNSGQSCFELDDVRAANDSISWKDPSVGEDSTKTCSKEHQNRSVEQHNLKKKYTSTGNEPLSSIREPPEAQEADIIEKHEPKEHSNNGTSINTLKPSPNCRHTAIDTPVDRGSKTDGSANSNILENQSFDDKIKQDGRREISPKEMLSSSLFYVLWVAFLVGDLPIVLIVNYYKEFGQLYIRDDHHLTAVGTVTTLFNTWLRIAWGVMIDKLGTKHSLATILSLLILFNAWFYLSAIGGKLPYMIFTVCFGSLSGALYSMFPAVMTKLFGKRHFSANFGLLSTASIVFNLVGPIFIKFMIANAGYLATFATSASVNIVSLGMCLVFIPSDL